MTKLYKIVSTDFQPINGGSGRWHAPPKTKPGKWMPKVERVEACASGYHLVTASGLFDWLPTNGAAYLCEAEGRGKSDADGNKTAFEQARLIKVVGLLDDVSMRLAAVDIAERVLPIFLKERPDDTRPAAAIKAARAFALGEIDDAARAAAGTAAWDAAWSAARAAAWDAAGDAAGTAAWAAAGDAAGTAARAAARDAAGTAARAAARAAAWDAAGDAAWAAAGDAAGTAAGDAARDAAGDANTRALLEQAKSRLEKMGGAP